ncbi:MAG: hypothetical protein M1401_20515 [Chloroflexi bacterium]|nr:hypothetical protein [Chloroflexota bacterium]MCL5111209.1 hypothetical protein [Chloroflexota bacterium]
MAALKTMHDIRTSRSIARGTATESEGAVYLQLHRLASEKLRLERETEQWQLKKERIEKRMCEIEQQMESLRSLRPGLAPDVQEVRAEPPKKGYRQVTLEY